MFLLRQVGPDQDDTGSRGTHRTADSQAADLLGCRDVSLQQCRRNPSDADIVEAVARVVLWKQRRNIDIKREQVADGIPVFGPVEALQPVRASGIGLGFRCAVERRLQVGY